MINKEGNCMSGVTKWLSNNNNLFNKPICYDYVRRQFGRWFATRQSGPINREQNLHITKILQMLFFRPGQFEQSTISSSITGDLRTKLVKKNSWRKLSCYILNGQ